MPGLEEPAVALATAVVRCAVGLWLKDTTLTADGSMSVLEIFGRRANDYFQRSKAIRTFDQMAETVAARKIIPLLEHEYRDLSENEKQAAILAVAETFNTARLNDNDLFQSDLNAGYIQRHLRPQASKILENALLSDSATQLYQLLLRECCEYVVQAAKSLPEFQANALTQLLARSTQVINSLQDVLDRLPERSRSDRTQDASASVIYRRQIINMLDEMELFGASLTESSRHYPLSLAYISLSVLGVERYQEAFDVGDVEIFEQMELASRRRQAQRISVESVLQSAPRLFIRGEAGSGKTTILKWLAVRTAARSLPVSLASKADCVPFYIPMRRYPEGNFPTPSEFVNSVGRHLAEDLPSGWVSDQLELGRAIVLVDGIDELPDNRREDARTWLRQLLSQYDESTFIVTSRPGAVPVDWLESEEFSVYALQPMDSADIRKFVKQWHDAVASQVSDIAGRMELINYQSDLIEQILTRQHLKRTAETPLLCALICALNRERRGRLPASRLELYEIALTMLLERRDIESNIMLDADLSRSQKVRILQDIAYWLVRNEWADASKDDVIIHIGKKLQNMQRIKISAAETYRRLLERSGVIREPVYHRVDFIHKSFQEYLAAREALAVDDMGILINNSHLDQWRDVVVMAAGLADTKRGRRILRSLLARGDRELDHRETLYLVAMACLETCQEILPTIRAEVQKRARPLLPPHDLESVKDLARCGDIALELLLDMEITDHSDICASIRLASEIGSELAMEFINRYRMSAQSVVLDEIRRAWPKFDVMDFATHIIKGSLLDAEYLWVADADIIDALTELSRLRHLECVCQIGYQDVRKISLLRRLQRLTLTISKANALEWLRESEIDHLEVTIEDATSDELRRLTEVPHIRSLTVNGWDFIDDYQPFEWFRDLIALRLCAPNGAEVFDSAALEQLALFVITRNSELAYIEQLERLDHPETLGLVSCSRFRELSGISSWSSTLRHLSIAGSDVRSLSPIARLSKLEVLDVSHTPVRDLSPIKDLGSLRAINLMGCRADLDIRYVTHLPHIEFIILPDGSMRQVGNKGRTNFTGDESSDVSLQWRVCQKMVNAQFVPCLGRDGESLEEDGSRWMDTLSLHRVTGMVTDSIQGVARPSLLPSVRS